MDMASEVARLADAAEQLVALRRAEDRRRREEELAEKWGDGQGLRHVGLGSYLRAVPSLAAQFARIVPDEFVAQTDEQEWTVACPCGETPIVVPGELTNCGCGRWFLNAGRHIHVALTPAREEVAHAEPASAGPPA